MPRTTPRLRPPDLSSPPSTGIVDLARLGFALAGNALRHPRTFNAETVFRDWARRAAARRNTENLLVNFLVKKLILVGSADLSRQILAQPPSRESFSTGSLKRSAMAFLAAHALTISDDEDWRRRRAFNEGVLEPERRHEFAPQFVRRTLQAFAPPIAGVADLRAAMGRAMLGVVFGAAASSQLVTEIEALFDLVQNPVKRVLTAPFAYFKRARLYDSLRTLLQSQNGADKPSLLQMADRSVTRLDDTELLQQVPHWMFTFTGSATDLVLRTLTLITSTPSVQRQVMAELQSPGPLDGPAFESAPLLFLEACLVETGHLYPPVTRTFHRAAVGATLSGVQFPPGTEIMHLFPLFTADLEGADAPSFHPDRWLAATLPECAFDPFLGGARRCPGRSLILVVCKTALASLLLQHRLAVKAPGITAASLPAQFPSRGLSFFEGA
jgi:cytochrome P450